MYSIIATKKYFETIKNVVLSMSEDILYENYGPFDYNGIIAAFEEAARVTCSVLIIDIEIGPDIWLVQGVKIYKKARPLTRVILLAPGRQPGDITVAKLVNKAVYDILAPELPDLQDGDNGERIESILIPLLKRTLESKPANISDAFRWDVDTGVESNVKVKQGSPKPKPEVELHERTVVIEKGKILGTVVIAVAGTMKRIGTTHMVISLASYLKELNFNVATMELQKSNHFTQVKNSYEDVKIDGNMFTLEDIDFYPYNDKLSVLDVIEEEYNYLILDMGVYNDNNCSIDEFKRANVRIIVSGAKDWEFNELESILNTGDKIYKNKYYFTFADKSTFNMVRANMDKLQCYQAPYNPQPFFSNKDCADVFKELLKEVLPESNLQDNKSYLKRLLQKRLVMKDNMGG